MFDTTTVRNWEVIHRESHTTIVVCCRKCGLIRETKITDLFKTPACSGCTA